MNSLRARLILAFAAVAVVPLAIAVVWLGQRIQSTVRDEADARLGATLAAVEIRLGEEQARVTDRVATLAADRELRRLYLLGDPTRAELRELLAREARLLDLDALAVLDRDGRPVANASTGSNAGEGEPATIRATMPIAYVEERAGDLTGAVLLDSTRLARLGDANVELVVRASNGHVLATTDPDLASLSPADTSGRIVRHGRAELARTRSVAISGAVARITALAPTIAADQAVASLRRTAALLALGGVGIAVLLGLLWSRRISLPVERLAAFSERIARGEWDEPLSLESMGEIRTLVASLERMRRDLGDYRERLRAGERQAAYGRMARQVAHEIRNPLTPIAVSVADLRRSFALGRPEFPAVLDETTAAIDREIHRLKTLLEEFAELGRFRAPHLAHCDLTALLGELATLHAHEVEAGRLRFTTPAALPVEADADQLRQALLNLIRNALEAVPVQGPVEVRAAAHEHEAEIVVADHGPGLDEEQKSRLFVPGYTTKPQGSGIGLAIVDRIVGEHGGRLDVESAPGRGAAFRIRLPLERGD